MDNITCKDSNGSRITRLYQWDKNVELWFGGVETYPLPVFQFSNDVCGKSITVIPRLDNVSQEYLIATVPNDLLKENKPITACICKSTGENNFKTMHAVHIPVIKRPKPSSEDEPVYQLLTYKSEDGTTTYQEENVLSGGNGNYTGATPTKPSTSQYEYVWSGWSATAGGSADPDATKNVTEDRIVYAAFTQVPIAETYTVYFMNYSYYEPYVMEEVSGIPSGGSATYTGDTPGKDWVVADPENYTFIGWSPEPTNITEDTYCYAQFSYNGEITDSWATISSRSSAGTAENYYSIGDSKKIILNGMVGTEVLDHVEKYIYIVGFNHNSSAEGSGITFGCFRNTAERAGRTDQCIVDDYYSASTLPTNGVKSLSINHWRDGDSAADLSGSYGGWKGCDLRYDILGSTNVQPSGYGATPLVGRVGYDATSTCATSPVSNTLMSCLPEDLRAIMKPITKYTDNVGGGNGSVEENVTTSVDYLPLMSAYEIYGSGANYHNTYENGRQAQYAYYAAGNSKKKRRYESDYSAYIYWWSRSVTNYSRNGFISIDQDGVIDSSPVNMSFGLSPVLLV